MESTVATVDVERWPGLTPQARQALTTRYELLDEVGQGGMGVVYRARQRSLDRLVALKVTKPGISTARFLREARLLAQIHSPQVVTVHDCDVLPDGFPVLVMEWVDGSNLSQLIAGQRQALDESRVLRWMRQTAEGMLAAAEMGIIHRDLKPSNLLIDHLDQARVVDFGLARGREQPADPVVSAESLMGTPYYMAPEQAEDPHSVDTRADVYSFGATFYHALTGVTPFTGSTAFSVLFKHKTEPLIPPRSRNPQLSEHLSQFLERCLAKAPNERFQSFAEVRRYLDPCPGEPSPWQACDDPGLAPYLARFRQRRGLYLGQLDQLAGPDVYDFPGGRRLLILADNLAEQVADALVSSDDAFLTMGGRVPEPRGVAAALRRAAGPEYAAEAQRLIPVRLGRAVVTSAGRLKARFVFHGVTLAGEVEDWVCPSRDLIAEILNCCFYHADTLNVQTIALPLLGTGAGGFSREVCLDTMFRFLARFLFRGLTSVREARLVLFRRNRPSS
jgi:O-acetyl-ADP-ribose deacetylase (regulator of RNase III)/tRNA A-37 threonylcarbamoyl transferase component Bud32